MKQFIHIKSGNPYHTIESIMMKDSNGFWIKGVQYKADYEVTDCVNNFCSSEDSFMHRFASLDDQKMPKELWHPMGSVELVKDHTYRRLKDDKEFVIWKNLKGNWIDASGKSKVPFTENDGLPF